MARATAVTQAVLIVIVGMIWLLDAKCRYSTRSQVVNYACHPAVLAPTVDAPHK